MESRRRSFGMILDALRERKQAMQARMQNELGVSLSLMQSNPELAGVLGGQLVKRYGDKVPLLSPVVDALQARGVAAAQTAEERAREKRAYDDWMSGLDREESSAQQLQQQAEQMQKMAGAVSGDGMGPMFAGIGPALQSAAQGMVQQAQQRLDPQAIQFAALEGLPMSDRMRASFYASENKRRFPQGAVAAIDPESLTAAGYEDWAYPQMNRFQQEGVSLRSGRKQKPATLQSQIARKEQVRLSADLQKELAEQQQRDIMERKRFDRETAPPKGGGKDGGKDGGKSTLREAFRDAVQNDKTLPKGTQNKEMLAAVGPFFQSELSKLAADAIKKYNQPDNPISNFTDLADLYYGAYRRLLELGAKPREAIAAIKRSEDPEVSVEVFAREQEMRAEQKRERRERRR